MPAEPLVPLSLRRDPRKRVPETLAYPRPSLHGGDVLPMRPWAGGDGLALRLPIAQTEHLGLSHLRGD